MPFNAQHIAVLDRIVEGLDRDDSGDFTLATEGWAGSACRAWAKDVSGIEQLSLPIERMNRRQVRELVQSDGFSDDGAHLAIMAWGGQRRDHGRAVWASFKRLQPILSALRAGALGCHAAYAQLHELTTCEDRVKCLGPAYYTKLLFFLPQREQGVIMDQWTAKSMQLLFDRGDQTPIVKLSRAGFVERSNSAQVYDQFCIFVGELAQRYQVSDGNAEELIFSGSGQPWRDHVRAHWSYNA